MSETIHPGWLRPGGAEGPDVEPIGPDRAVDPAKVEALTESELSALRLALSGLGSVAAADALGISARTLDKRLERAYQRLGLHRADHGRRPMLAGYAVGRYDEARAI